MDTSKTFPILVTSDPVSSLMEYSSRVATAMGQGTSWTNLTMLNSWTSVSGYPLQIRQFGRMVEIRGLVKPPATFVGVSCATIPAGLQPGNSGGSFMEPAFGTSSKAWSIPYITATGSINPIHSATYSSGTFTTADFIRLHYVYGLES